MKSIRFSLVAILVVIAMGAVAQEENTSKFYIKVYGGYGLITPGSYRLESSFSTDMDPFPRLSTAKKGLGAGIRAGGGIGVIASDFLNIGIDVEYLSGATLKVKSEYISPDWWENYGTEVKYKSLTIVPHVIFKAVSKPGYLIYNKLGILVNLPFDLEKNVYDTVSNPSVPYTGKTVRTGSYKIKLGAGLNVALGVQVKLNEKLRAFGELFGNYLVLTPETYSDREVETGNNGGVISINNSTTTYTYIKEGELSSSYTNVANDKGGFDREMKENVPVSGKRFNMNSIGINIGITFRF